MEQNHIFFYVDVHPSQMEDDVQPVPHIAREQFKWDVNGFKECLNPFTTGARFQVLNAMAFST